MSSRVNSHRLPPEGINPGKIIILNGTSSAGKTSILKELQRILPEPYMDAGIDKFIWMLPSRYLDRPLWDDVLGRAVEAGEMGHRLVTGMHHALAALSKSGLNVLADHVLVEPAWVKECAELLRDLPAYLIGIRCPLEVVEQRERSRRDRTLGQAGAQYEKVHQYCVYDFEVDTSTGSVEESAQQIAAYVNSDAQPFALQQLRRQTNT
ncbi:MAG: chloramphenicol phosphotransferase [Anaerolineae bacterium]|jgi:chloramphenicol 3-O phosphotransferase|nr:chloramphenicol phosphotransferase [Anaerolineae bacterium]